MESLADLAFLSDSRSAALVDRTGSVRWYCPRRFDGPAVFASLLDPDAGHWRIGPAGPAESRRSYVGDGLVLRTEWHGPSWAFAVTDALVFEPGTAGHEIGRRVPHLLVRRVEELRGRSPVEVVFAPRPEYGLVLPRLVGEGRCVEARGGSAHLRLHSDVELSIDGDGVTARFEVSEGKVAAFALAGWEARDPPPDPAPPDVAGLLDATIRGWSSWNGQHTRYEGEAAELVRRSAVVLQGLTDATTGAVMAAATTSLPELLGGDANWDYRYAWLRDLSFVMRALWIAACPDEADAFLRFLAGALGRLGDRRVPIVLGADGRRDLTEHRLEHLRGYRGSRPVRVGNDAWLQQQHDVLGEVIDSAHLMRDQIGQFPDDVRELLVAFADRAVRHWREPDAGMWEARDRDRQYTSSKVMCWVALDRAVRLADRLGDDVPVDRWSRERDTIRETVLREAWSERTGAYAGALGSDDLDASVLLLPMVDFLPADDPRMAATIQTVRERLTSGPLVHRWDGDANGFLLCSYWLAECEWLAGERGRAADRFAQLNGFANDLGLLTEMVEPRAGEPIGNVPQAFSHIGLVNAAWRLTPHDRRQGM